VAVLGAQLIFWLSSEVDSFPGVVAGWGRIGDRGRFARRVVGRARWGRNVAFWGPTAVVVAAVVFILVPRGPFVFESPERARRRAERARERERDRNALRLDGAAPADDGLVTVRRFGGFGADPLLSLVTRADLDDTPLMLVRCTGPDGMPWTPRGSLRLRGLALWRYQRGSWRGAERFRRVGDGSDGAADGWVDIPRAPAGPRARPGMGTLVTQEILAAPLGTAAVFALPEPVAVAGEALFAAGDGTLQFPAAPLMQTAYTVRSRVREPESAFGPATLPLGVRRQYLQGPVPLAAYRAARDAADPDADPAAQCAAVAAYLGRRCAYATETPIFADDQDPIEQFLTVERRGVCVHFASAMVLMLRSLGVPSRVVVGFATGESDGPGGAWMVRRRDAHAWVEAHLADRGWVTYDPTPPVGRDAAEAGTDLAVVDWSLAWRRYGPPAWAAWLQRYGAEERARLLAAVRAVWRNGGWQALAVAALLWVLWWAVGRCRPALTRLRVGRGRPQANGFYAEFLRVLERRGVRRRRAETPRELAGRAEAVFPDADVGLIVETYCEERFGLHPTDQERLVRVQEALARLQSPPAPTD
ncbi:MAG: transglutaminaseTgpA domain-containing protein, partial [Planctomycetota bacterium]